MASILGFRKVQVYENVTPGEVYIPDDLRGAFLYSEVTNDTDAEVKFIVNDNPQGGHPGVGIPIPAKSTRAVPVSLYSFRTTGVVTVVAYGM